MKINTENIKLSYEIEKLKSKLKLSSEIATAIDEELLKLKVSDHTDLDAIFEKISEIRDGLRDLADFMKEK